MRLPVHVRRLDPELPLPVYAREGDAAVDLLARVDTILEPGQRVVVPTGIAIALPDGYAALVQPRSGLAARHGLTVVNTPGLIDSGYRGEIQVILLNSDREGTVELKRGDRIAQMLVQRVEQVDFIEVEELPDSARGEQGLGSSGGFSDSAGNK